MNNYRYRRPSSYSFVQQSTNSDVNVQLPTFSANIAFNSFSWIAPLVIVFWFHVSTWMLGVLGNFRVGCLVTSVLTSDA